LGCWKEFRLKLIWTEGHVWTTPKPIKTKRNFFRYKYVVLHGDDEPKQWEGGVDRIADLKLLRRLKEIGEQKDPNKLELIDNWNSFCIKFTLNYPTPLETE
jgi:hypothetical protein